MAFATPGAPAPYHVLSVEGLPKTGKTDLSLTAPGPMLIQSTDRGWDGVVQKKFPEDYSARFIIGEATKDSGGYYMQVDLAADEEFKEGDRDKAKLLADNQAALVTRQVWNPFKLDYEAAIASPTIRSITWDFANEFYDILRVANFGKLERNDRLGYAAINAEFSGMIRKAHQFRKTLILVNQLSAKWETYVDENGKQKGRDTGLLKRKGPESIGFLVHSYIRCHKVEPKRNLQGEVTTPGSWKVEILSARQNPEANGTVLDSPDWVTLMMFLAPDVPAETWL